MADPFAEVLNRIPKRVVSRSEVDLGAWSNSVAHTDFPVVVGQGRRLFGRGAQELELVSTRQAGVTALLIYRTVTG